MKTETSQQISKEVATIVSNGTSDQNRLSSGSINSNTVEGKVQEEDVLRELPYIQQCMQEDKIPTLVVDTSAHKDKWVSAVYLINFLKQFLPFLIP